MSLLGNLSSIVHEVKATGLAIFNLPTDGRASILNENLSRQNLPAREGLGVLVTGNPEYDAYFAPIGPTGSGFSSISFSSVDGMTGGRNMPLPFKIIAREEGQLSSTCVSEEVAREYSRVIAEMVQASESHKLLSLPSIEALSQR